MTELIRMTRIMNLTWEG